MDQKNLDKVPSKDKFPTLSQEEQKAVLELNSIRSFPKGHVLINEGAYLSASYFMVKGIVRQYKTINEREITNYFYAEQTSIYTPPLTNQASKSEFSLECLEDCDISVVSFEKQKEMYNRFPRFEKMCRIQSEKDLVSFQSHFARFISSTPEERYLHLLETTPELIQRVPHYHLASYLGIKPESLSRIRKRIAKKN